MSLNLKHIAEGWGKTLGVLEVSPECKKLSAERLEICTTCEHAKESAFLKLIHGKMENVPSIFCTLCGCPCNEKSLVESESCPVKKW